jgi:hypothetical protein
MPVKPHTSLLDSFQSARTDGDSKMRERFNARSVAFSWSSGCCRGRRMVVPDRRSARAEVTAWKSMKWRRRSMAARLTSIWAERLDP